MIIQLETAPSAEIVAELRSRGAVVLSDIPENGLLISVGRPVAARDLGIRFAAPIDPADKLSPAAAGEFHIVEFHPDVDSNDARGIVLNSGIELRENPDLHPHHLLVRAAAAELAALAKRDEVAYIFPASAGLVNGVPTRACSGALTANGPAAQSIPTYGDGWDGPGLGSATLSYVFSAVTSKLDPAAAKSEMIRAMSEWSKAVQVTWQPASNATGSKTVNILFASGDHGDGYPFDGAGGVLAHTFYPAPPNPEPIAGDMHFDNAESWHIGANTDLFSVALHELGHSLGLGHSDDPTAVMYPYYRMATSLSPLDIATVQKLYAAASAAPSTPLKPTPTPTPTPTPSVPLTLAVNAPPAAVSSSTISISGATSGGKAAVMVTWATDRGQSGTAQGSTSWSIAAIPLASGANTIAITATDGLTRISQSFAVTYKAPAKPSDTTPPSITINSPSGSMISTAASSIVISGTAADNTGVASVTWSTNTGRSGIAAGTSHWSVTVPLLTGSNSITIQASDAAGNAAWRSVVVKRM